MNGCKYMKSTFILKIEYQKHSVVRDGEVFTATSIVAVSKTTKDTDKVIIFRNCDVYLQT